MLIFNLCIKNAFRIGVILLLSGLPLDFLFFCNPRVVMTLIFFSLPSFVSSFSPCFPVSRHCHFWLEVVNEVDFCLLLRIVEWLLVTRKWSSENNPQQFLPNTFPPFYATSNKVIRSGRPFCRLHISEENAIFSYWKFSQKAQQSLVMIWMCIELWFIFKVEFLSIEILTVSNVLSTSAD